MHLLLVGIRRTSQRREGLRKPPLIKGLAPYRGLHRPSRLAKSAAMGPALLEVLSEAGHDLRPYFRG